MVRSPVDDVPGGQNQSAFAEGDSSDKNDIQENDEDDEEAPLILRRRGDVIGSSQALLTLTKSFVGTGCLSIPFAWKQAGLLVAFVLQLVVSLSNWYCSLILSRSSQRLALQYVVNITILLYQVGCSAVPIVFMATNISKIVSEQFGSNLSQIEYASMLLVPVVAVNMIAEMRFVSWLAITSSVLWFVGALPLFYQCLQQPSQWQTVPLSTDFWSTVMFVGTVMYAYEGQTMVLPVENKLRHPDDFIAPCGVLTTLMVLVTVIFTALGFYGYTAYGEQTKGTLSLNMPDNYLFAGVTICFILMAFFAHPVNLYVIFDMLWPGFRRKMVTKWLPMMADHQRLLSVLFRTFWVLVTYVFAIAVPRIDSIVSLVGGTAGMLCAFVYPPLFECITFWHEWRLAEGRRWYFFFKVTINVTLMSVGIAMIFLGLTANIKYLPEDSA
ncbi:unnamed protein product [Soboliphyme baturini]|uniref:Aa_trans domain-containing protein n=1 Tax=Soboliphyme baturini TaxID=241478 RepID=A0A183IGJ9_9BILA|nr:unnamed protein product [Soboliphyme baturini]